VIHIHGLQDTTIPFDGGTGTGPAAIDGPPVPAVIDQWRAVDRCAPATTTTAGVVTTAAGACAEGRAVELVTIADGARLAGLAGQGRPLHRGRNQPSQALDATGTIWRFFAAHPKP
jgi:polyhydroxybutyrate depolymerase